MPMRAMACSGLLGSQARFAQAWTRGGFNRCPGGCIDVARESELPRYVRLLNRESKEVCDRLADAWPVIEKTREIVKRDRELIPAFERRFFSLADEEEWKWDAKRSIWVG